MSELPAASLLGNLLVEAQILDDSTLDFALARARENKLKIGEQLLCAGLIGDQELDAAIQAQRLVRDSILSTRLACTALQLVHVQKISFDRALNRVRELDSAVSQFEFGALLLEAKLVSLNQWTDTVSLAEKNNYCPGRVLVMHGRIAHETRQLALYLVILLRCASLTYESAIQKLQSSSGSALFDLDASQHSNIAIRAAVSALESGALTKFETMDIIESLLSQSNDADGLALSEKIASELGFAVNAAFERIAAENRMQAEKRSKLVNPRSVRLID